MTGSTIDSTNLALYSIIIVYLIIISIFSNRYLDFLSTLKKKAALQRLNQLTVIQFIEYQSKTKRAIRTLVRTTLFSLITSYGVHLGILAFSFGLAIGIFKIATIIFGSSLLMLFIVFWLKGSGTVNSNQRIQRTRP